MSANRKLHPLRDLPPQARFKKGDVLVVFGELFARGYANGIVDEAERAGLTVVRSTVGRRDGDGKLRALHPDELALQAKPFINIPLEAGFDNEPCAQDGTTPVYQIKSVKMSEWEGVRLDWSKIESSRKRGTERFRERVTLYLRELDNLIPKGANVLIAHTMAGGVPRAKILMPTMNRVFKGTGDRHLASEQFWRSDLGRFCEWNFEDVTALSLKHLLELSEPLQARLKNEGGSLRFVAYGYHGTEVLTRGEYLWQSYAPYLQGWAKLKMEDVADEAWQRGTRVTVYNCPEILTNSSSIFQGVEVPLYTFIGALEKEGGESSHVRAILEKVKVLLKPDVGFAKLLEFTDRALTSEELRSVCHYERWPEHSRRTQMEALLETSDQLIQMHRDAKNLMTFVLSEEIFRATGYLMFHESFTPRAPVYWLGHDILARTLASGRIL